MEGWLGVEFVARELVIDNADKIIEILQEWQLSKGIYSDGKSMGEYSKYTQDYSDEGDPSVAIKPKPYGEAYNFQWTGKTFEGMYLKHPVDENEYSILTRDGKQEVLKEAYGKELFKLTEDNNKWINENIIEPGLVKYVEENWFLID